jgi:spindle assembly abnormal protein 6
MKLTLHAHQASK